MSTEAPGRVDVKKHAELRRHIDRYRKRSRVCRRLLGDGDDVPVETG
jgi:hypothetical protein